MTTPRKPTAREAWEAIDEASFKVEVDRVVGMSDEEVEAELLKDGFDPAELAECGGTNAPGSHDQAVPAATEGAAAEEEKIKAPIPLRRTRWTVMLAAAMVGALVMALGTGMAVIASNWEAGGRLVGQARPDPRAEALRQQALDACGRQEWQLCLQGLDEAKALDPHGDRTKSVEAARAAAEKALLGRGR